MKCRNCGAMLGEDAKFCSQCGEKVIRCSACGALLEENAKFCSQCGTKVETSQENRKEIPVSKPIVSDDKKKVESQKPTLRENNTIQTKYDTCVNAVASYQKCACRCGNFTLSGETSTGKWISIKDNSLIEYKGKLYYCGSKHRLEGEYVPGCSLESDYVLASIDPTSGESHIYKEFSQESVYWEYCTQFGGVIFTVRDDKIYYIALAESYPKKIFQLLSVDIHTGEEHVVCEKLKTFNTTHAWNPIIGNNGLLYSIVLVRVRGSDYEEFNYIVDYNSGEKVRYETLLGYNETYVYYQRGKAILQLEIDTFQETKFSDVFLDKKKKSVVFVDCSRDLVFYKEDEKEPIGKTRLLGYNFQNENVVTFELPKLPDFNLNDSKIMFTGNRYVLDCESGGSDASAPVGIVVYDANGDIIKEYLKKNEVVTHSPDFCVVLKSYLLFLWEEFENAENKSLSYYFYATSLEQANNLNANRFVRVLRYMA